MTQVPKIDPEEEIGFMNIDETDFSSMSRPEQIRHLEVEGYVVLPRILDADRIARIKRELADAQMYHTSYSQSQTRSETQPQWLSEAVAELIGYPPMIEFLTDVLGDDFLFTRGFFSGRCRARRGSRYTRTVSRTGRICLGMRGAARGCCGCFITWMS